MNVSRTLAAIAVVLGGCQPSAKQDPKVGAEPSMARAPCPCACPSTTAPATEPAPSSVPVAPEAPPEDASPIGSALAPSPSGVPAFPFEKRPSRTLPKKPLKLSGGYLELTALGATRRLEGRCGGNFTEAGPYAEVIDPDSATPRFIVHSCGANGVFLSLVGTTVRLPGAVKVMRIAFLEYETGAEWVSEQGSIDVTSFPEAGGTVVGDFTASMPARLNRPAEQIRGHFVVPRNYDRYSP